MRNLIKLSILLISFSLCNLTVYANSNYINISDLASAVLGIEDPQTALDEAQKLGIITPYEAKNTTPLAKHQVIKKLFDIYGIGFSKLENTANSPYSDISNNSALARLAQKSYDLGIESGQSKFLMAKRLSQEDLEQYIIKIQDYKQAPTAKIQLKSPQSNGKLQQIEEIWDTLHNSFLYKDRLDDAELIRSAIKGMTQKAIEQSADPYTVFQEPAEAKGFFDSLSGEYEGVGMIVESIEGQITVVSPFKDSPAEKAGIKPNDIILEVDNQSVTGLAVDQVVQKIKGPSGSSVKITISRQNTTKTFEITRSTITYKSLEHEIINKNSKKIAHVNIRNFGETTYQEFLETIEQLKKQQISGLIIDLRNNPGGYLDVAVNVIETFSNDSLVAVRIESAGKSPQTYQTRPDHGLLAGFKTVILINEGSASASEILAGALQDHGLATLIGSKSFGKGTVQNIRNFDDGSFFKFTTARWLTPNGTDIQKNGLEPDISISNSDSQDLQLQRALAEF